MSPQETLESTYSTELSSLQEFSSSSVSPSCSQDGELYNDLHGAPPRINAGSLPTEVLIEILSNLSPEGLDSASLVCKNWHDVLTNDASWRCSFQRQFELLQFNRVSSSMKWRTELITRLDYLRAWRKGRLTNLSFNGTIMDISHLFSDFASSRLTLFSKELGIGVVADPTKGKIAKQRIYTNNYQTMTQDVCSIDGSRFGMIYGFKSGSLAATLFSHRTRLRDFIKMQGFHRGKVTSVWINHVESPRTTQRLGGISGGEDGHVFFWNLAKGSIIKDFVVNENVAITYLFCDSKDTVVAVDEIGNVYARSGNDDQFINVTKLPFDIDQQCKSFAEIDFSSKHLVFANGCRVARIYFGSAMAENPKVEFDLAVRQPGTILSFAIDQTSFPRGDAIPGNGCRYIACATNTNLVYVWLLQGEPDHSTSLIKPLRVFDSPFHVGHPNMPDIPSITSIALNAVVLLVGSYNGVTVAYDLLSGDFLRVVSSRFSKKALNLRNPDTNALGLLPTTHLEVDADPGNPHGVIVVGSAVQYFDLGVDLDKSNVKKKGIKKLKRPAFMSGRTSTLTDTTRGEIEDEIRTDLELMKLEEDEEFLETRREARESNPRYFSNGLSEEEQLAYAMMISQETAHADSESHEEEDEDLKRVLELSLQDAQEDSSDEIYEPSSSNEIHFPANSSMSADEELEYALRLSLAEANSLHTS